MNRDRSVGLALAIIGVVYLASASRRHPPSALALIAGGLFLVAGLVRALRARR